MSSKNNIKNFHRISNVLVAKAAQTKSYFLAFSGFSDFVSEDGQRFFEKKGANAYLGCARAYWKKIKDGDVAQPHDQPTKSNNHENQSNYRAHNIPSGIAG